MKNNNLFKYNLNEVADELTRFSRDLSTEFSRCFNDISNDIGWVKGKKECTHRYPLINIYELNNMYVVKAYIAGAKKEDLSVEYDAGILTIKGKVNVSKENMIVQELKDISFERSFEIKENKIDIHNILPKYEDGILSIFIYKKEVKDKMKIDIK